MIRRIIRKGCCNCRMMRVEFTGKVTFEQKKKWSGGGNHVVSGEKNFKQKKKLLPTEESMAQVLKNYWDHQPVWLAQWLSLTPAPRGFWFDFKSEHMPRFRGWSLAGRGQGVCRRQPTIVFLSSIFLSLPPSSILSLSQTNKNILRRKKIVETSVAGIEGTKRRIIRDERVKERMIKIMSRLISP